MLWIWHWPSSYTSEWTSSKSLSTNARQASLAFFDVVIPTENPNPRIWTTWLRSCLYRLVEPLTIKTVKNDPIVNNDKQCIPMSSQVTLHQALVSDRNDVCVLYVPVLPASCSSAWRCSIGNITKQEGECVEKCDGKTAHRWGIWLLSERERSSDPHH